MAWIARLGSTATSFMCSPEARRRQRGAMLVELMTGLTIGLMVTLAALGTLAFLQTSALVQGEAFRLQQRIDIAMQTIGVQLRQAGAVELQATQDGTAVSFSNAFDGHAGSGFAVLGDEGAQGAPDTLRTSHQDGQDTRDCLGNQPDASQAGIRVDSRFTLAAGDLRCLGAHRATGSQTIVDRVEDFQVRYGMRTPGAHGPAFRYVDATAVGARWDEVGAVSICIQVASESRSQARAETERLDCQGRPLRVDGHLRRVARATFSLRNMPF